MFREEKNPCFFGVSLAFFVPKMQGLEGQGNDFRMHGASGSRLETTTVSDCHCPISHLGEPRWQHVCKEQLASCIVHSHIAQHGELPSLVPSPKQDCKTNFRILRLGCPPLTGVSRASRARCPRRVSERVSGAASGQGVFTEKGARFRGKWGPCPPPLQNPRTHPQPALPPPLLEDLSWDFQ